MAVQILAKDKSVTFETLPPEQATQLLLELNIEMSRRGMHRKAQLPLTQVNLQRRLVISDDLTVDAFMVCLYEVESDKMLVRDVLALAMARLTRG